MNSYSFKKNILLTTYVNKLRYIGFTIYLEFLLMTSFKYIVFCNKIYFFII